MLRGQSVITPLGPGLVNYVRMAPPTYAAPEAVSVMLASKVGRPGYSGTIFLASEVTLAERGPCTHNVMTERAGDATHAWQCADCGHVYGLG